MYKGKREAPARQKEGEIEFTIKSHTRQRHSEGLSKTLCMRTRRLHRDWERPAFEGSIVLCGGTGQQWPAAGAGALAAADLGVA